MVPCLPAYFLAWHTHINTHTHLKHTHTFTRIVTQLLDIRYTELIASPTKTVEAIYRKFGLPGFERMRQALEQHERDQVGLCLCATAGGD